jgi:prepilin-type N-terminal cleavage/methylation domain-containing protein
MFLRQDTKGPLTAKSRRTVRRSAFTLVELLAAVALVAVLGVFLIRFYTNMQRAYNNSLRMASMSEDSRAVFALLTRDLRLSATRQDDLPGYDIKIHQPSTDQLWFVTSNESGSGEGTSLLEVSYRLNGTTLERAEVNDLNGSWNPYGERDDATQQDGYQPVLERVLDFRITCYNSRLTGYQPDQSSQAPAMITVLLTILDRKSFARWELLSEPKKSIYGARQSRTFRQTVQIPSTQFVVN